MNYQDWNTISLISDCLKKFGFDELANELYKTGNIRFALPILVKEASKRQDQEVLERLYFDGLIYI